MSCGISIRTWYIRSMGRQFGEVTVGDRGRVVLPAAVRETLGLQRGTRMLVRAERDGTLTLRPYRAVAERNRGLLADLAPSDTSMVDELLAERRREAEREAREA